MNDWQKLIIPLIISILVACQRNNPQPLTPSPTPFIVDFTPVPLATPTPLALDIKNKQTFIHASETFSITYPASWQHGTETNGVVFIDPTVQASYSILFTEVEGGLTPDVITQFLKGFVETNFADIALEITATEGNEITFTTYDETLSYTKNRARLTQAGQTLYITTISANEKQWDYVASDLQLLADSLVIFETEENSSAPPIPAQPPSWNLYTNPDQKVTFLYPTNWVITETEQAIITSWPELEFIFEVTIISASTVLSPTEGISTTAEADISPTSTLSATDVISKSDPELPNPLQTYTQSQADELATQYNDINMLPIMPYQVEDTIGFTFDFLYIGPNQKPYAGSVIIATANERVYKVTISAPALSYEESLVWFNSIMQSFQIIRGDLIPVEELDLPDN